MVEETEYPSNSRREKKDRSDTLENDNKTRPEGDMGRRIPDREDERNEEGRGGRREERESCELADRASEFTGDDRSCGSSRHKDAKSNTLSKIHRRIKRMKSCYSKDSVVDGERDDYLEDKKYSVPRIQTQGSWGDAQKSKEEHEENQARQNPRRRAESPKTLPL